MLANLFWLGAGLVVGAFYPNQIKPRVVNAWRKLRAWYVARGNV